MKYICTLITFRTAKRTRVANGPDRVGTVCSPPFSSRSCAYYLSTSPCFANSQLIAAKSGLLAVLAQHDPALNEPFFKAATVDLRLFFSSVTFFIPP